MINLKTNTYIRENKEYKIEFDFNNGLETILIKDINMQFDSIFSGTIQKTDNIIDIKYNTNDENKRIIIHLL